MHTVVSLQFVLSVKAEEFLTKSAFFLHCRTDEIKSRRYQRHVFCFDTDCLFAGTGVVSNSRLLFSHNNKKFAEEAEKFVREK